MKDLHIHILVDERFAIKLEKLRKKEGDLPSKAEMLRRLVERAK